MKARLKVFRDELLNKLHPRFAEFNFELDAPKAQFRSKREWGSVSIGLSFVEHGDTDFDVIGSVGLRIDAVQDLVTATDLMATKAAKESTSTMGAELGNISVGKQMRWSVKNEADVAPVAMDFAKTVEAIGLPFLEKYSNLNKALEALSGNEPSNWLVCPIHGVRCQGAVALAYVLGDQKRVEKLIEQGRAFLKARNDFGLPRFEALAKMVQPS